MTQPTLTARYKNQGSTLVVAMIMLLLIAIIGVGAIQTTTLEEKMAANQRDKNISFQAAEAGLKDREDWLGGLGSAPFPGSFTWLFDDDVDWDGPYEYGGGDADQQLSEVNAQPQVLVQELEFIPDDLVVGFEARKGRDLYRVLSRGSGQSPNAETTLESTFAKRFN